MKTGDVFHVENIAMLKGLVGRLVDVRVSETSEMVTARIVGVDNSATELKVVPKNTKD